MNIIILAILALGLSMDGRGAAIIDPATNALAADLKIPPKAAERMGHFGSHVAQRSNVVAIAYQTTDFSPTNSPLADIYHRTDTGLVFQASIPRPATPMNVYGVATDGQRIAIAASEGALPAVYLYKQAGGGWALEAALHPSAPVWSISMSGDFFVCGSSMKALLFQRAGDQWLESPLLPPEDAPSSVKNGFGADVAMDGETILVGASGEIRSDPGRAYVYARDDQQWRLQAELLPDANIFTPFGSVLALRGDTALVSAYPTRFNGGFVYLFKRSAGAWHRVGALTSLHQQDLFGRSLAIDGRNLFVGAPSAFGGAGGVYLFRDKGGSLERFLLHYDDFDDSPYPPNPSFGGSISADGNTLLAGADGHSEFAESSGLATLLSFNFGAALISPFVRMSDQSFHFRLIEAEPGETYVLESVPALGSAWNHVTEFFADQTEMQLQVNFSASAAAQFFRVRIKE